MEFKVEPEHKRGWWDPTWHTYPKRRSVQDITEFVGWNILKGIVRACELQTYERLKGRTLEFVRRRDKALVVTSFLTGGRVTEVLDLKGTNFDTTSVEKYVVVKDMLLEKLWTYQELKDPVFVEVDEYPELSYKDKRYFKLEELRGKERYVRRYITKRNLPLSMRKDFPIHRAEDEHCVKGERFIADILEPWIDIHEDDYLFLSTDFRRQGKSITSSRAYQIIMNVARTYNIGKDDKDKIDVWPHWFRAQRASQLFKEWNLSWEELKLWFAWKTDVMAQRYARISVDELASRMEHKRSLLNER